VIQSHSRIYKDSQAALNNIMPSQLVGLRLVASVLLLAVSATCSSADDPLDAVLGDLPPITVSETPSPLHPSTGDLVSFTKRVYSALGTKKTADVALDFKGEYATLNWDGALGERLEAVEEMRMLDLQLSVQHARKLRDLLTILDAGPTAPYPNESDEVHVADELAVGAEKEAPPPLPVKAAQASIKSQAPV
jgi:hypothetical protein